jgi:hypothetical protein
MPKNWLARSVGGTVLLLAACQGVVPPPPAQVRPAPPIVVSLTGDVGIVVTAGSRNDVLADVWRRAAAEQGVPAVVVDESGAPASHAALILPDGVARNWSDTQIAALGTFVEQGGRLLVVFDAATLTPDGFYPLQRSRLSQLAGVDYALYDRLRDHTFRTAAVYASAASARRLGLPPGKFVAESPVAGSDFNLRLATYTYGQLAYPTFVTEHAYDGEVLLRGDDGGVVAGIRSQGAGRVIFVNLPLGRLKMQTDGWLLHRFLRLLAQETALPTLAMTPDAVGGMVMNLHCDSNAALRPLAQMDARGFFDQGPFSIHVTAGPGLNTAIDGLGIDVPHNLAFQAFLRTLVARGQEIGSHGGWIHNDWAAHVTPESEREHARLLELNGEALANADGVPVRVYSSPSGNHPPWVTHWLRRHDYLAFYTTANDGAAPTRLYRNGVLEDDRLWSFPIMSLGAAASFEDAAAAGFDEKGVVQPWLEALARFVADEREVRLVYFHPTGVNLYEHALDAWVAQARALSQVGRYRWYTMAGLANFLDRRQAAAWRVEPQRDGLRVQVSSNDPLDALAWVLPAATYREPIVQEGEARVRRDGDDWLVTAASGRTLAFDAIRIVP